MLGDLYRMGYGLDIDGAGEKTVKHLKAAAAFDPTDPKRHFILGLHLTFSNNVAAGELELLRAYPLTRADDRDDLHYVLAINYCFQQQFALTVLYAGRIPASHPAFRAIAVAKEQARKALDTGTAPKKIEVPYDDTKGKTDVILQQ